MLELLVSNPSTYAPGDISNLANCVSVVPSFGFAVEIETVASHYCDHCATETTPKPLSMISNGEAYGNSGWILFPCHESECSCCYAIGVSCSNCSKVSDCCDCVVCGYCANPFDSGDQCGTCSYCENCCSGHDDDYECRESCCRPYSNSSAVTPGWAMRSDSMPMGVTYYKDVIGEDLKRIDPVQAMADFYLADYVIAVLGNSNVRHGSNNGNRPLKNLLSEAMLLQGMIVQDCDAAFRDYGLMAVGGELRHHAGVQNVSNSLPSGRDSAWEYFYAMAEKNGRALLLADAVEIYGCDTWQRGYGGDAWKGCAQVLLWRENGTLDSKTFVDRVFSLQHNGGSLLNKMDWARKNDWGFGTDHMKKIGDAHASDVPRFGILLECASSEMKDLMARFYGAAAFLLADNDRHALEMAFS